MQCGSPHCLILPLPRHWGLPRHLLACGTLARRSAGGCLRDKEAGDQMPSCELRGRREQQEAKGDSVAESDLRMGRAGRKQHLEKM